MTLLAFPRTVSHGGQPTQRRCLTKEQLWQDSTLSLPSLQTCSQQLTCLPLHLLPDAETCLLWQKLEMTRQSHPKSLTRRHLRRSTCALSTVFSLASRYGTVNTPLLLERCMVTSALPTIATSTFLLIQSRKSISTSSFLHPKLSAWRLSSSHTQISQ